jgi:DNA-binding response OmpR family regulator
MKKTWRILLVEDDFALGPLTLDALTTFGHQALLAYSFSVAYEYLTRPHAFQVILLDLELGMERGDALIHRLRAERYKLPRIVILSGLPESDGRRIKDEIGAHGYSQKPKSLEEINHALDLAMA